MSEEKAEFSEEITIKISAWCKTCDVGMIVEDIDWREGEAEFSCPDCKYKILVYQVIDV